MRFWEYNLSADTLVIGERIKKGTFRPLIPSFSPDDKDSKVCYRPLPYSIIVGALREFLGVGFDIPVHAAGYLTEGNEESLIIAPQDNFTGVSKLPITIQYLTKVKGKLFILVNEHTEKLLSGFNMVMGGMRYKGFGLCSLKRLREHDEIDKAKGILLTRIPEDVLEEFGIEIDSGQNGPYRWGYLFKPTSDNGGVYVKSLFERSGVEGYKFLLEVQHESG